MHYFFDASISGELKIDILRVSMAKLFGWTLDYIDSIPIPDLMTIQGVLDGMNRYEEQMSKR